MSLEDAFGSLCMHQIYIAVSYILKNESRESKAGDEDLMLQKGKEGGKIEIRKEYGT